MRYTQLGGSGLQVSVVGFGATSYSTDDEAKTLIGACLDHGINFFDCAESYSAGDAEVKLGRAFKELGVPREDIVVSTKLWTSGSGPNRTGLSAKRVREGTAACLARLQLEYVDVLLAHRPDDATPMEETVRAFNGCLERGQALYWGCSRWPTTLVMEAWEVARRLNLVGPLVEQGPYSIVGKDDGAIRPWPFDEPPLYNGRERVEREAAALRRLYGMGCVTFSPLAGGLLAKGGTHVRGGKAVPDALSQAVKPAVDGLAALAEQLGVPVARLALAWCLRDERAVSTVVFGASSAEQVAANVAAVSLSRQLDEATLHAIDALSATAPRPHPSFGHTALQKLNAAPKE